MDKCQIFFFLGECIRDSSESINARTSVACLRHIRYSSMEDMQRGIAGHNHEMQAATIPASIVCTTHQNDNPDYLMILLGNSKNKTNLNNLSVMGSLSLSLSQKNTGSRSMMDEKL